MYFGATYAPLPGSTPSLVSKHEVVFLFPICSTSTCCMLQGKLFTTASLLTKLEILPGNGA
jgi:hypothetical protein